MHSLAKSQRPLSPFLTYRRQYTMVLSILHRITGVALSVGLLPLAYWLVAAASGAQAYEQASRVFTHPLVRFMLIGLSFSFFYHLLNGLRHLVWDTGHGLEKKAARLSGWIVFITAVVVTVLFWFLLIQRSVGGAA
jgi:succinate dehydrogenase cytochrome b subunit